MANKGRYMAEVVATFCMVFCGTGAIAANAATQGTVTHVGVSLVFGLVVLAMIYAVGPISGAHMNPAVTLAFSFIGRMEWREAFYYIVCQLAGALAASVVVSIVFGPSNLGGTLPAGSWQQAFILEFVLTFILMFVIMGVAHDERAEGLMAGVAIGATVALEALLGGPISGASMNPARSLAPALVSGNFLSCWIYIAAPIMGALTGAILYRRIKR
jgi:MIP family channel proteins